MSNLHAGVILSILALCYLVLDKSPAEPQFVIEHSIMDLGEIDSGPHSIKVPFTNTGRIPLRITDVVSSCACAVVNTPSVIASNEQATIQVQITAASGPGVASLQVLSNDPKGPHDVLITWKGNGKGRVRLVPISIAPFSAPITTPYEQILEVIYSRHASDARPKLVGFKCVSPLVDVRLCENDSKAPVSNHPGAELVPYRQVNLQVRVQPPGKPGIFRTECKITLCYGDSNYDFNLPISVPFVADPLRTDTTCIVFSAVHPDELRGQERSIEVCAPLQGSSVFLEDLPEWLESSIGLKSSNSNKIQLRMSNTPPRQTVSRTILIKSNQNGHATILPVHVFISNP